MKGERISQFKFKFKFGIEIEIEIEYKMKTKITKSARHFFSPKFKPKRICLVN